VLALVAAPEPGASVMYAVLLAFITSSASGGAVEVSSTGKLGMVVSSARYKRDIRNMDNDSSNLMKLRPVTFRYKDDPQGIKQYRLVAEEVEPLYPELVIHDTAGKVQSIRYSMLTGMLLNELKKQFKKDTRQAAELQYQARQLLRQSQQLSRQGDQIKRLSAQVAGLLDFQQVHRNRAAVGIEKRHGLSLTRGVRLHLLQLLFAELPCGMMLALVMPMVMLGMVLRRGRGRGRNRWRRWGRLLRNTDTEPAAQKHDGRASD
jgi:hypothetical protein